MSDDFKIFLSKTLLYLTYGVALYVAGWKLEIISIWNACMAYDNGTLTGGLIFWTIIKCIIIAPVAAKFIATVGCGIALKIIE